MDTNPSVPRPRITLSPRWRVVISLLVLVQLWAMLGRPIEFATQGPTGPSPAATTFYDPVRGYSEFTYLNHGYAFFAPDPGPSHLIQVSRATADGDRQTLLYPDLKRQWPRLLYHRHFMLTEFLNNTFQPPGPPPELAGDEELAKRWTLDRQRYEAIRASYLNHLKHVFETDEVALKRIEHQLVGLPEFLEGQQRLDDPSLYIELEDEPSEPLPSWPRFGEPIPVPRFGGAQP